MFFLTCINFQKALISVCKILKWFFFRANTLKHILGSDIQVVFLFFFFTILFSHDVTGQKLGRAPLSSCTAEDVSWEILLWPTGENSLSYY